MRGSKRLAGAFLSMVVLAAVAAGCGNAEEEAEPVTPPVANPARAKSLAGRYEPNLMLERSDGFWPVAVRTIDLLRNGDTHTCLAEGPDAPCDPAHLRDLPWTSGPGLSYLDYPADSHSPEAEQRGVNDALKGKALGTKAAIYYYVTGRSPDRPVTLQYWFYYPFNYLEAHLFGVASVNSDLHEGDIEGMSILLSAGSHRPVYVWMPRHRDEGERFAWNEGALEREGTHPVGYAAKGSHATYESCGRKFRTARVLGLTGNIPDDYFSCGKGYPLTPAVPAIDLARTWWACWPGHLGFAPHHGSPLSEIYADGPTSPLYQQKFDLRDPKPCAGVAAPPAPEPGQELLDDQETARQIDEAGGRLNDLFRSCQDWWQRPPEGSYMVACDQGALDEFFESGLEDPGKENLRIEGDPAPRGPSVPAVFSAPAPTGNAPEGVDGATITAEEVAHPVVFAAVRDAERLQVARFPEITVQPGQRLRLRRPDGPRWQLVDLAAGGRTVAEADVHETESPTSPQKPVVVEAVRRGDSVEVRFTGGIGEETSFTVYGGDSRAELLEGGHAVGTLASEPDGEYELTIPDPERRIGQLRVLAFNEGALAASPLTPVSEGG
jgi:hypothetical protein